MAAAGRFRALVIFLIVLWAIELLNGLSGHSLNGFGLLPRSLAGLPGIFTAPLLHGSLAHLASNTAGLAVLGALVAMRGERAFVSVSLFIALAGGALTWLLARSALHVGASIVVFGYFGFLLARGFYERTAAALAVAIAVAAVYGGLLFGLLPAAGISFEGHLFGLLAGVGAAALGLDRAGPVTRP